MSIGLALGLGIYLTLSICIDVAQVVMSERDASAIIAIFHGIVSAVSLLLALAVSLTPSS